MVFIQITNFCLRDGISILKVFKSKYLLDTLPQLVIKHLHIALLLLQLFLQLLDLRF